MTHYQSYTSDADEFIRGRLMSDTDKVREIAAIASSKWQPNDPRVAHPQHSAAWEASLHAARLAFESQRAEIEKLQQQHAALLSAAKLTVRRIGETGDAISINALNKAIGACHE